MSNDDLKSGAAKSVADGVDIRAKVRDMTLAAIRDHRFDFTGMREVMSQMADGITIGAEKHGTEMRQALSQAFAGLDEAFTKSAHATQLALSELTSKTKEFNETELKATLENLKTMEKDLLGSMAKAAERTGGQVKKEMQELAAHATRTGTDTGAAVAKIMGEFSSRVATTAGESTAASFDAARKMSERFAQVASGFLAGMSEALTQKDSSKK
jgi:cell division septum initiation protein DivIVA